MPSLYGRALLEWSLMLAVLPIFGTGAFALFFASFGNAPGNAIVRALLPLWRVLAAAALVIAPFILLDITAEMAAVSWGDAIPLLPAVMADTHVGRVWTCCLPVTGLLLAGAFLPQWSSVRPLVLLVVATLLLLLAALASHAADAGVTAVAMYFLHEIAVGLWLGALLGLWLVAKRGQAPEPWVEDAARRVSQLAAWCVLAIVLTGAYSACSTLGLNLDHLLFSTYGRMLIAKTTVFGTVLGIGAYNRYRLVSKVTTPMARKALLRNVGVESLILLAGVLALAAFLANTPPGHNHSLSASLIPHDVGYTSENRLNRYDTSEVRFQSEVSWMPLTRR